MTVRSDSLPPERDEQETIPDEKEFSNELLTLFNFAWLKFLSRKRTIDRARKLVVDDIAERENEQKISSMRHSINDLTSS